MSINKKMFFRDFDCAYLALIIERCRVKDVRFAVAATFRIMVWN